MISSSLFSSQFEELDKPPEGAHKGQMLLGGSVSIGYTYGDIIKGEKDFVAENTYTFDESEVTKDFLITHLAYDFGISFEYMPIDHIGIKTKLKRVIIVQRTLFGSDFQNWNETLYKNYSFLFGPSFHLTDRKQWDITLTPVLGYAWAKYNATPIAAELLSSSTYTDRDDRERDVNGLTYGAELSFAFFLSGGLYFTIGCDWNRYPLSFSPPITLSQSSGTTFLNGKTSGNIDTVNLSISAGYAFSN